MEDACCCFAVGTNSRAHKVNPTQNPAPPIRTSLRFVFIMCWTHKTPVCSRSLTNDYSFFVRRIAQSSQPGDFGEVHSGPRTGGRGIFSPVNALNQLASYAPGSSLTVTVPSFGR